MLPKKRRRDSFRKRLPAPGTVVIEVTKTDVDKYQLIIDGNNYSDVFRPSGDGLREDSLILQSHWGGGVSFSSAKVKKQ